MSDDALTQRVLGEVDALRTELLDAVARAVRIPSVSPKYPGQAYDELVGREGEVSALVAEIYREAGAEVDLFAVEEGRENAVGLVRGTGGGRSLIYNGHIDVVPAGREELWTESEPFSGEQRDGRIWGRGSTDMKAGVLAQAFAALALKRAGVRLKGDLILEAVVGEETGDHERGTTATIQRGYRADAAVVSEPSAPPAPLGIVPATPGFLWGTVTIEGKAAHAGLRGPARFPTRSGAALGVNAIDKAVLVIEGLSRLEDEWAEHRRHPLFQPGSFGVMPGVIHGSPHGVDAPFFLADSCTIEYAITFHPDYTTAQVEQEIEERIAAVAAQDPWLRDHPPTVEWKLEWEPWITPVEHPLCQATIQAHERASTGTVFEGPATLQGFSGVGDVTWFEAAGIPALIYGPGDLSLAHAPDEFVDVEEVVVSCRTFALLAMEWCGVDEA